jgi:hypothetical protein
VNDAQRYRANAVECLSAAKRCGPGYRNVTLAIARLWLSLSRHQQAMDELLAIWSKPAPSCRPYQAGRVFTSDLHLTRLAGPDRCPDTEVLHQTSTRPKAAVNADYGMIRC